MDRSKVEGCSEDEIEALLALECAGELPASENDVERMLDLVIPRFLKVLLLFIIGLRP